MAAREATCFERAGLLISAIKSRAAAEADGSARADAARFVELTFAVRPERVGGRWVRVGGVPDPHDASNSRRRLMSHACGGLVRWQPRTANLLYDLTVWSRLFAFVRALIRLSPQRSGNVLAACAHFADPGISLQLSSSIIDRAR